MKNITTETDGLNTTLLMTQTSKHEMCTAKKNWRLRFQPLIIYKQIIIIVTITL